MRDDEVFLHRYPIASLLAAVVCKQAAYMSTSSTRYFRQKVALEASSKKSKEKEKEAAVKEGSGDEHQDIYLQGNHMDMDFAA